MVDTEKLMRAIKNFEFHAKPSNGTLTDHAEIGDITRLIDNIATLLKTFVKELEK